MVMVPAGMATLSSSQTLLITLTRSVSYSHIYTLSLANTQTHTHTYTMQTHSQRRSSIHLHASLHLVQLASHPNLQHTWDRHSTHNTSSMPPCSTAACTHDECRSSRHANNTCVTNDRGDAPAHSHARALCRTHSRTLTVGFEFNNTGVFKCTCAGTWFSLS